MAIAAQAARIMAVTVMSWQMGKAASGARRGGVNTGRPIRSVVWMTVRITVLVTAINGPGSRVVLGPAARLVPVRWACALRVTRGTCRGALVVVVRCSGRCTLCSLDGNVECGVPVNGETDCFWGRDHIDEAGTEMYKCRHVNHGHLDSRTSPFEFL